MNRLFPVLHLPAADSGRSGKVSLGDIEAQLRSVTGSAQSTLEAQKPNAIAGAAGAAALLLAGVYLHGRRRGRKRATVLEIRRV